MSLFGSSGIRRNVDKGLLRLAFEVGLAVGSTRRSVLVGTDTRTSGEALKHALTAGLLSAGCRTYDAGVAPTPTVAHAARRFEAGAVITASHNPPEDNGIKLVNPDGSAFDAAERGALEALLCGDGCGPVSWARMEAGARYETAVAEHLERVLADFSPLPRLKVVLDCGCGAASLVTPHLLRRLGCEAVTLNCHPSGFFPRGIEPTPENLAELAGLVRTLGADLGLAHDGDADRLAVIDDRGRFVSGDQLLALLARDAKVRRVVTTVDASMALEDLGFEVVRTRVGDAYVSEAMRGIENSGRGPDVAGAASQIGGEASGCFIFPQVSLCPDGIYAAAKVLQIAAAGRISALMDDLPSYSLRRGSLRGGREVMPLLEERLEALGPNQKSTVDGVRLDFGDGWLLVRASGTESKIRLTAEARSGERAEELYRQALEVAEECLRVGERMRP